jgi:hypothetical protein
MRPLPLLPASPAHDYIVRQTSPGSFELDRNRQEWSFVSENEQWGNPPDRCKESQITFVLVLLWGARYSVCCALAPKLALGLKENCSLARVRLIVR